MYQNALAAVATTVTKPLAEGPFRHAFRRRGKRSPTLPSGPRKERARHAPRLSQPSLTLCSPVGRRPLRAPALQPARDRGQGQERAALRLLRRGASYSCSWPSREAELPRRAGPASGRVGWRGSALRGRLVEPCRPRTAPTRTCTGACATPRGKATWKWRGRCSGGVRSSRPRTATTTPPCSLRRAGTAWTWSRSAPPPRTCVLVAKPS